MNCDLCGGIIEMRENGAVCTGCGMQYSMEALRKKLGKPSPAPATAPAPQPPQEDLANLIMQAELVLSQGNTASAVSLCDIVLSKDPVNEKAWHIKLSALCRSNLLIAAQALCTASSQLGADSAQFKSLQEEFLTCARFREPQFSAAQHLSTTVPEFARTFAECCMADAVGDLEEFCAGTLKHFREAYAKSKKDGRWAYLLDKDWALRSSNLSDRIKILEHAVQTCDKLLARSEAYPKVIRCLQAYMKEVAVMLYDAKNVPLLADRIAKLAVLADAIEQAGRLERAEAYWSRHPGVREALQQEAAQLEARQAQYSAELKTLNEQDTALKNELAALKKKLSAPVEAQSELDHFDSRIVELNNAIGSLNFFQGKRRKELEAELEGVMQTRSAVAAKVREQIAQRDSKVNARMDEIKTQLLPLARQIGTLRRQIADCAARLGEISRKLNKEF